jgi:hypothetical protein
LKSGPEPEGDARGEQWGTVARLSLAAGVFASVVSFSLFVHLVSQLASPLVSALFIAAGIVGRRRAATQLGHAVAVATLTGGAVAAIASIALAAAGR